MNILSDGHLSLDNNSSNNEDELTRRILKNPLLQKDVWLMTDELGCESNQHHKHLTISFESIKQDWFRLLSKLYILMRSRRKLSATYIKNDLYNLNKFSYFIESKSVCSANLINNQIFDEFDYYLHSLKLSETSISKHHMTLLNFFNLCREEGWLEVNTYWFKGRFKKYIPKNDDIEYIPEEVWQQLNEHLHYLPEPIQRMVLVIRSTGLRIGELLNLPLDCLRHRDKQWRLRFLTEKYRLVDELPICEELVIVIKEQQEYIKKHLADSYNNLFSSNNNSYNYTPAPKVMSSNRLNWWLNKLAKEYNICDDRDRLWHFKSHQFRKTFATVMTNAGIRDLIIQKYLRHRSSDMQNYYKHLFKEVLGAEYEQLMNESNYINSTGEIIAIHKPSDPITEVIRRKMYHISTQYGECHRPILKSPCQTVNACWRCEDWVISINDLTDLKHDLERVEAELNIASELGMVRQEQGLIIDKKRLLTRIEKLEKLHDTY
jgi:integrase/recombinase XerD